MEDDLAKQHELLAHKIAGAQLCVADDAAENRGGLRGDTDKFTSTIVCFVPPVPPSEDRI